MKKYPKYKDSGVSWIGEIPEGWKASYLKRYLSEPMKYGANESGEINEPLWPRYIRITDIDENGKLKQEGAKTLNPQIAQEYKLNKGDILFARSGATVGKTFLYNLDEDACYAGYLIKAVCNQNLLPAYLMFFTKSIPYEDWKNRIFIQATIQNIGADKYSIMPITIPPISEQSAIVSYLDKKTSQIDNFIGEAEKEIDLLDELKQAQIARLVTRGLNPNVPMKDSGIAWIRVIPEHWEVKRIAMLFSENKTKNMDYEFDHAMKFNYGRLIPKEEKGDVTDLKDTYVAYTKIRKNDIAINCLNLNYDFVSQRVAIATEDGILTSAYLIISPRDGVNADYYNYFFKAMDNKKLFHGMGTGIRLTLSYTELKKQYVVVPPVEEQAAIVSAIETLNTKIDTLTAQLSNQIEHLKELKQRIISDAVTGKIDVRN